MSDPDPPPTVDALTSLPPDIFQSHVLARLEPWEVRVFARASRSCRALVLAADPSVRDAAAAPLPPARVLSSPALVAWALENNLPRDHRAVESIAEGAPLDTLLWARAHRRQLGLDHPIRWTRPVLRGAVRGGRVDVLEWARDAGLSWNRETCKAAAKGGHLDVLMWLRANGCPWDEWTVVYAERGGHPETARWARENGCE